MCGPGVACVVSSMIDNRAQLWGRLTWSDRYAGRSSIALTAQPDFATIYRSQADSVYRFCLSQLRDPAVAEDVAADVFASAFAAFARTTLDDAAIRPWLFRIARNATIDHMRRSRTRRTLFARLRDSQSSATADVETVVVMRHDLRAVLAAMNHLRARDRQLIGLRIAAGLSYGQIATVMRMRENAARMATQRALEKVRARMEVSSD